MALMGVMVLMVPVAGLVVAVVLLPPLAVVMCSPVMVVLVGMAAMGLVGTAVALVVRTLSIRVQLWVWWALLAGVAVTARVMCRGTTDTAGPAVTAGRVAMCRPPGPGMLSAVLAG